MKGKSTFTKDTAKSKKAASRDSGLTETILKSAHDIATKIKAKEILVCAQGLKKYQGFIEQINKINAVLVVGGEESYQEVSDQTSKVLKVPDVKLTRMGQIKVAVLLALSSEIIKPGDKIVCVTGVPDLEKIDSVVIIDTGKEFEIFSSSNLIDISSSVRTDVFETALNLAIELGSQGREGRSVGTIFVLGDDEKVLQLSRQMIINPFKGYSDEELTIHDPQLREAIKEFSAIDGAFVIREDGVLVTAGRHLNAALEGENLPQGLGSRHVAAAGITSLTNSIAIVISESTGSVRIFKKGNILMDIERPTVRP